MIKNRKQSMIVIGAFIFILMLFTTTYAFFNYTRTGNNNTIRTGRIAFNADQGNNTVTLSDLFPIQNTGNITSSTPGVGSLKLHITGDTNYTEGIEYLIEAVDVTGNGNTSLPISIEISYASTEVEPEADPNAIGTADDNYFTNRGGETSRYKLLSTGSISEGEDILVGYIAPGNTGIDGELTILAYLDADNIAITDTYDEDEPETDLNGTTTDWIDGRTVFTTEEWNALQATGVSFKIKATANEGTWVTGPVPTIPSCPGCVYTWITGGVWDGSDLTDESTSTALLSSGLGQNGYVSDYREVISSTGYNSFIGFTIDNNLIDDVYVCAIKNDIPYCLQRVDYEDELFARNIEILQSPSLWNNTCIYSDVYDAPVQNVEDYEKIYCGDTEIDSSRIIINYTGPYAQSGDSYTLAGDEVSYCFIDYEGEFGCDLVN